jgi:hypothetical protein
MQIKIFILTAIFSTSVFSYECQIKELRYKKTDNKKEIFKELREYDRQAIVSGLLFDLTSPRPDKKVTKKSAITLNYLENTELNSNQRDFFKLLSITSEVETGRIKKIQLNEVCEIMEKVNKLKD